jgi:hypothetical protein
MPRVYSVTISKDVIRLQNSSFIFSTICNFEKTREGLRAPPLSFCLIAEMKSSLGGRGFRRKAGKPSFNEKDNGKDFAHPPFRKNK